MKKRKPSQSIQGLLFPFLEEKQQQQQQPEKKQKQKQKQKHLKVSNQETFSWILRKFPEFGPASPSQQEAIATIVQGYNTLIVGGAGTGKSWSLKLFAKICLENANKFVEAQNRKEREREEREREKTMARPVEMNLHPLITRPEHLAITAFTGVAAINLYAGHAMTLHGWMGCGLATEDADYLVRKMRPEVRQRWLDVKVLIIDEWSMVPLWLFEKIHQISILVRPEQFADQPFGGIQIVLSGDPMQLLPIPDKKSKYKYTFQVQKAKQQEKQKEEKETKESKETKRAESLLLIDSSFLSSFLFVELKENFRQGRDPSQTAFLSLLSRLRLGKETEEEKKLILSRSQGVKKVSEMVKDYENPTIELFSIQEDARNKNLQEMSKLLVSFSRFPTHKAAYDALTNANPENEKKWTYVKVDSERQEVRIDYETVMMKSKIPKNSKSVVLHEKPFSVYDLLRVNHSSSSLSFSFSRNNFLREDGEASLRWQNLLDKEGLVPVRFVCFIGMKVMLLKNLNVSKGLINGRIGWVINYSPPLSFPGFYRDAETSFAIVRRFPRVWFPPYENCPAVTETIGPFEEKFIHRDRHLASRIQIPLTVAFASTIHKVQGLTLTSIILDASNLFAEHMLYVATSRIKTLEGLFILNYKKHEEPNKRCLEFIETFPKIAQDQIRHLQKTSNKTLANFLCSSLLSSFFVL